MLKDKREIVMDTHASEKAVRIGMSSAKARLVEGEIVV